jgi:hypothetical protein
MVVQENTMEHPLDFDPQLPDLRLAFDRDSVIRQFEQHWPPTAPAPRKIHSCRLRDTKYQPATRCLATYDLALELVDGSMRQTIGVVEVNPAGLAHRLYNDDPKLPWLIPAADPAGMRDRFATLLQNTENVTPTACTVTPVRYRAGTRCVFRYDLASTTGEYVFFGKLIGQRADQFMATVTALHRASLDLPDMARILPPLAYWPDVHMLVQPEVAGRAELNDLAFDPATESAARERWLRDAGRRLAGLHNLADVDGPPRTLEDDLSELEEYIAPMHIVDAQLAERYVSAIATIRALAREHTEPALVASHGAFRTDQFMIEDDRLVMIDLDGFCWASPARDIGNYMAYLRWKTIRQPQRAALIEQAGQMLLAGYQALRQLPDPRWLAIYQADSMLKIAGRRFRSLTTKEWYLVPALIDGANQALEEITR